MRTEGDVVKSHQQAGCCLDAEEALSHESFEIRRDAAIEAQAAHEDADQEFDRFIDDDRRAEYAEDR